jgi:hypothetical protein
MRIEVQFKHRNRARRVIVPVCEFSFAAFQVVTSRVLPRCGGSVAPQFTTDRQIGAMLAKQDAVAQTTGI